jgi:ribonuclease HI
MRATVIADASFCPETRAAGWAAWITLSNNLVFPERIKRFGAFHRLPEHSTQAEEWALYNGLWLAYQRGAREILAQTDCLTVIDKCLSNNAAFLTAKAAAFPDATVSFRHVKGHTNREEARFFVNRWCDANAKRIMIEQRKELGYGQGRRRRNPQGDRPDRGARTG